VNDTESDINRAEMLNSYPDCLNVLQLQQILSIGRNSTYRLLETGQIKTKRIGRKYIIPKVCVIDYLLSG